MNKMYINQISVTFAVWGINEYLKDSIYSNNKSDLAMYGHKPKTLTTRLRCIYMLPSIKHFSKTKTRFDQRSAIM